MMYFVEAPRITKAVNRKCEEIQEFVYNLGRTLVADKGALEAMIEEIRAKVDELNKAYPRTKKVVVKMGVTRDYIICQPEIRNSDNDMVFSLRFEEVRNTYGYYEIDTDLALKGGEQ